MTTATDETPSRPKIVGLGELLWDVFPDQRRPGGAPANFAWHANQMGARGLVVSRVGADQLGDELVEFLDSQGLDSGFVQRDTDQSTGTVSITTTVDGQPDYTIHEPVAWVFPGVDRLAGALFKDVAAVCFGTIAQRLPTSRATIGSCLDAMPDGALKVYDINLRKASWELATVEASLDRADIVKLNDEELEVLAKGDSTGPVAIRPRSPLTFSIATGFGRCLDHPGADGCLLRGGEELVECKGESKSTWLTRSGPAIPSRQR
ncbi:MAG: hypothetical protein Ct9H300mP1_21560 [Planctomycetaceae bacterium]|nr:MAG: hypothetical protein Ct9H300mP1_21560 [Planctomycetaceae bacterium]